MADEREPAAAGGDGFSLEPAAIEGWKNAREMEAASAQVLRSEAAGIYAGMVHALRPQGRDWQAYQAVRPCAHRDVGIFDAKGPFPDMVLEIQIGTQLRRGLGAIMNKQKDLTPIIMEAMPRGGRGMTRGWA